MAWRIKYDPDNGFACPDGRVEDWYQLKLNSEFDHDGYTTTIGSEVLFNRYRLGVSRGEIPFESVEFWYKDEHIPHRKDGSLVKWPNGLCDTNQKLITELTRIRRKDVDR